jgi:uncharacterized protein YbjT (DUF2867 family)
MLITGANGVSGSIIVREFARQKARVKALVRSRAKARWLEGLPTVELVEGDMLRPETLGPALKDVSRVLMISSANEQLVETQCRFIDACRKAGVGHVVKFSGSEEGVRRDKFRFTRMHDEIERYLEGSGLVWTHLRPSQFMQVYLREIPTIVAQGAFFLPMGNAQLEPVDIEDIAKVAFALLHSDGHEEKSYDITGPEALTMTDIAQRISEAIGKPIRYVDVSPDNKRAMLLANGVSSFFTDGIDELFSERRLRHQARVCLETHDKFKVRPTAFAEFAVRNAARFRGESGENS